MRKAILFAFALAGGLIASLAYAQLAPNVITGNEVWVAQQGPGGPGNYISINTVRGGTANITSTLAAALDLSTTGISRGGTMLITAQPGVFNVTLPANPVPDGAVIGFCNTTAGAFATNAVSVLANTGQTLAVAMTLTTLGASTCQHVQWNQAALTWYRAQ